MAMSPVITSPCLIGHYICILFSTLCLVCCQLCIMHDFSLCRSASLMVAACISSIDKNIGMSTALLVACMLMLMPVISWSLFSTCLFQDDQSTMHNQPDLYKMHTLYWRMPSLMQCNHWDSVATPLLIIITNGLWSIILHTSLPKQ